jgi:hypothetical protein
VATSGGRVASAVTPFAPPPTCRPAAPTRSRAACCASIATACWSIGADAPGGAAQLVGGRGAGSWGCCGGQWRGSTVSVECLEGDRHRAQTTPVDVLSLDATCRDYLLRAVRALRTGAPRHVPTIGGGRPAHVRNAGHAGTAARMVAGAAEGGAL